MSSFQLPTARGNVVSILNDQRGGSTSSTDTNLSRPSPTSTQSQPTMATYSHNSSLKRKLVDVDGRPSFTGSSRPSLEPSPSRRRSELAVLNKRPDCVARSSLYGRPPSSVHSFHTQSGSGSGSGSSSRLADVSKSPGPSPLQSAQGGGVMNGQIPAVSEHVQRKDYSVADEHEYAHPLARTGSRTSSGTARAHGSGPTPPRRNPHRSRRSERSLEEAQLADQGDEGESDRARSGNEVAPSGEASQSSLSGVGSGEQITSAEASPPGTASASGSGTGSGATDSVLTSTSGSGTASSASMFDRVGSTGLGRSGLDASTDLSTPDSILGSFGEGSGKFDGAGVGGEKKPGDGGKAGHACPSHYFAGAVEGEGPEVGTQVVAEQEKAKARWHSEWAVAHPGEDELSESEDEEETANRTWLSQIRAGAHGLPYPLRSFGSSDSVTTPLKTLAAVAGAQRELKAKGLEAYPRHERHPGPAERAALDVDAASPPAMDDDRVRHGRLHPHHHPHQHDVHHPQHHHHPQQQQQQEQHRPRHRRQDSSRGSGLTGQKMIRKDNMVSSPEPMDDSEEKRLEDQVDHDGYLQQDGDKHSSQPHQQQQHGRSEQQVHHSDESGVPSRPKLPHLTGTPNGQRSISSAAARLPLPSLSGAGSNSMNTYSKTLPNLARLNLSPHPGMAEPQHQHSHQHGSDGPILDGVMPDRGFLQHRRLPSGHVTEMSSSSLSPGRVKMMELDNQELGSSRRSSASGVSTSHKYLPLAAAASAKHAHPLPINGHGHGKLGVPPFLPPLTSQHHSYPARPSRSSASTQDGSFGMAARGPSIASPALYTHPAHHSAGSHPSRYGAKLHPADPAVLNAASLRSRPLEVRTVQLPSSAYLGSTGESAMPGMMNDGMQQPGPGNGGNAPAPHLVGQMQLGHAFNAQEYYSALPGAPQNFGFQQHQPSSQMMYAEQGPTVTSSAHGLLPPPDGAFPSTIPSSSLPPPGPFATHLPGQLDQGHRLPPLDSSMNGSGGFAGFGPVMGGNAIPPTFPGALLGSSTYLSAPPPPPASYYDLSSNGEPDGIKSTEGQGLPFASDFNKSVMVPANAIAGSSHSNSNTSSTHRLGSGRNERTARSSDPYPTNSRAGAGALAGTSIVLEVPPRTRIVPQKGPDGKKRYPCSFPGCDKTFSTSGHAARHSRIHTGCKAKFSRQDNSLQHYRTHIIQPKARPRVRREDDSIGSPGPSSSDLRFMPQHPAEDDSMQAEDDDIRSINSDMMTPSVALGRKALEEGTAIAVVHDVLDSKGRKKGETLERMVGAGGKQGQSANHWNGEGTPSGTTDDNSSPPDSSGNGNSGQSSQTRSKSGAPHSHHPPSNLAGSSHESRMSSVGPSTFDHQSERTGRTTEGSTPLNDMQGVVRSEADFALDANLINGHDGTRRTRPVVGNGPARSAYESQMYDRSAPAPMTGHGLVYATDGHPGSRPAAFPQQMAGNGNGNGPAKRNGEPVPLDGPTSILDDFRPSKTRHALISDSGPTWMTTATSNGYGAWPGVAYVSAGPVMPGGATLQPPTEFMPNKDPGTADFSPAHSVQASPNSMRAWQGLNDADHAWEREREERMALYAEAGREAAQTHSDSRMPVANSGSGRVSQPFQPNLPTGNPNWQMNQRPVHCGAHNWSLSLTSNGAGLALDGNLTAAVVAGTAPKFSPHWRSNPAMPSDSNGNGNGVLARPMTTNVISSAVPRPTADSSMSAPPVPSHASAETLSRRQSTVTVPATVPSPNLSASSHSNVNNGGMGNSNSAAPQSRVVLPQNADPVSPTMSTASSALLSLSVLSSAALTATPAHCGPTAGSTNKGPSINGSGSTARLPFSTGRTTSHLERNAEFTHNNNNNNNGPPVTSSSSPTGSRGNSKTGSNLIVTARPLP
ncbi:unnamed protein product [Tilletia caries]|nr:unnamed protein product [Tilletia caries]